MALTSISILHFEERGSDDVSHRGTFTLKSKLELLGYEVKKVSFMPLKEQTSAISEIESCLKHFHFLIVLINNLSMANTLEEYVGKIFDVNSLQWKQLKHPTIKITSPVLYFQRLFIVDNADMSETYHNILERYLLYFIKPKPLCKVLKVKNSTSLTCLESLYCDKVKMEISDSCIKLTSFNLEDVLKAESNVKRVLKDGLAASCTHFNYDPELLLNFEKFQDAFEIIEGCFQTYQPENVCLCFNGGKDCTVLLHLTLMVLHKRFKNHKEPLLCLYIENHDPFPEIDVFIKNIVSYYDLNILTMKSSIKESLEVLSKNKPHIKACLMGTRRTDPYSQNLNTFQMTDPNWPQFMRVSPILDWHYSDIWDYIYTFQVPACKLYELGYTSLGNTKNTSKNPYLLQNDSKDGSCYYPAYKLLNENLERCGRKCNKL